MSDEIPTLPASGEGGQLPVEDSLCECGLCRAIRIAAAANNDVWTQVLVRIERSDDGGCSVTDAYFGGQYCVTAVDASKVLQQAARHDLDSLLLRGSRLGAARNLGTRRGGKPTNRGD